MNVTINRAAFAAALDTAKGAADSKSFMPILACVHLAATASTLTVTATDLNITSVVEVPCSGVAGIALVNATDMHAVVHRLAGDDVGLMIDDGNVLRVKAGRAVQKLPVLDAKQWVKVRKPPVDWNTVDGTALADLLRMCAPAVCHDDTRFHLTGVYLADNGKRTRAASTDGHRLHAADRDVVLGLALAVIVPERAVKAIVRLVADAGDVLVAHDGHHIHVRAGVATLSAKLIDAKFPPFEQVIPEHKQSATVDRAALLGAIQRAALATSETGGIRLTLARGTITIASSNSDGRESTEEIDAECARAEPLTIGANPKYLVEGLQAIGSDAVTVRVGGELEPILIHRADAKASKTSGDSVTVMPMRV